jgi:23S rRNA (adenine-N6)-dimethyltransferase
VARARRNLHAPTVTTGTVSRRQTRSPDQTRSPLRRADERRRIAYAQNFLRSPRIAGEVLDRADIGPDDLVYEIGPGVGIITERLAQRCRQVVAVEKDPRLAQRLRGRFARCPGVMVFEGDFLDFPLPLTPYKVFANVPFNITAAIITRLTSAREAPEDAYLPVQREAAGRVLGRPDAPAESLYGVLLKPWFEPSVVYSFRRADFVPAPGVDVVMLRLRKRGPPLLDAGEARRFRDLVTYCFTAWRPTVGRALAAVLDPTRLAALGRAAGDALKMKPADVPFDRWLALYRACTAMAGEQTWTGIAGAEARLREQQANLQKVHRSRR